MQISSMPYRAIFATGLACVALSACSTQTTARDGGTSTLPPVEAEAGEDATTTIEVIEEESVDPASGEAPEEESAPRFTSFENYRLSYASTCGDGDFYTEGTDIEVANGEVTVVGGEEPGTVGSIEGWNRDIDAGEAAGSVVTVDVGPAGEPEQLRISSAGGELDNEFCVVVTNFEAS